MTKPEGKYQGIAIFNLFETFATPFKYFCNKLDFQNNSKDMEYVQTSLRSATE